MRRANGSAASSAMAAPTPAAGEEGTLMADLSVIDRFTDTFSRYIDSGFGLLSGDVSFLSSTLIGIDLTLAGLAWSMRADDHIMVTLAKKVLYVGAFAFIIGNFKSLADI